MMIYKREIKGNLRSFIIWMVCIAGFMIMFMAMYPSFANQGETLNDLLEKFPPEMTEMFGFNQLDFANGMDYYAYAFQYVLLVVLIHFMLLGANLVSREEDSRTINFLYSKPVSRSGIIITKLLAALTYMAVFFIIYSAVAIGMLAMLSKTGYDVGTLLLFSAAISLGQLMMLGVGMLLSMFVTKARAVMSASIGVVMVLYVMSMFINMKDELELLKYFTPFQYFDARQIIADKALEPVFVLVSVGVAVIGVAASLIIYNRRDLKC